MLDSYEGITNYSTGKKNEINRKNVRADVVTDTGKWIRRYACVYIMNNLKWYDGPS